MKGVDVANSVAVGGEVIATVGKTFYAPADAGAWTPGPVTYETHVKLKVGGTLAIMKATCTFSFSGTDSKAQGALVPGTSTVELKAKSTKLNQSGKGMLLAGDSAKDSYGNTLTVQTTNKLKTA